MLACRSRRLADGYTLSRSGRLLDHLQRHTVWVHEVDRPAALVWADRRADRLAHETDAGRHQRVVCRPHVVDGEPDVDVADVVWGAGDGSTFRLDVLDEVQVQA